MSLIVGELKGLLGLDTSGFDKGLDRSESRFKTHGRRIGSQARDIAKQAGSGMAGAAQSSFRLTGTLGRLGGVAGRASIGLSGIAKGAGIVGVVLGAVGTAVISTGIKIGGYAANLELMGTKSARVFGDQLPKVQKWAAASAHGMGLTKREAVGLAAGFQDLLVPMGFARSTAEDMSTKVIGLSGALSEWSGGTKSAAEVADTLSAAMLGERDGLQSLGISISQAQVDTQVLADKKKGLKFATEEQAQAVATEELIFAKSTDAQKAYANGAGTLARKMAESRARLKEMGQTLLVTVTPALKTLADFMSDSVLPVFERFVAWFAGDGKYVVGDTAIAWTRAIVKFADISTHVLLGFASKAIEIFLKVEEHMPGGPPQDKIDKARADFAAWRKSVEDSLGGAIDTVNEWDNTLAKARTEAKIRADITDLQSKLAIAKRQLADKNLTKERRAQLNANITSLEYQIRVAKNRLADPALIKTRIAKLTADKTELEYRIRTAKQALDSPKLTATKRAKLTAYIGELQRQVNAAQAKINSLRGKTVVIRYTATGVNLTAPSLVGRRQHGGPVRANRAYLVGERGPEVLVPNVDGTVLPNISAVHGGAAGGGTTVMFQLPAGSTPLDRMFFTWLKEGVRRNFGGNVHLAFGTGAA